MLAQGNDAFVDAIEILKTDHKRLAQCFSEFFASRSETRRYELILKTCAALRVHIALEAEIFYPEFLNATEDTLSHFVAFVNHETVKMLVEGIENADPAGDGFSAQVYELSQLVAHHIREAEKPDGLFAEAQASGMDRDWVGKALFWLDGRNWPDWIESLPRGAALGASATSALLDVAGQSMQRLEIAL